jgi:type VI secretion system secreted protein VgrG
LSGPAKQAIWQYFQVKHANSPSVYYSRSYKRHSKRMQTFEPKLWVASKGNKHCLEGTQANIEQIIEYQDTFAQASEENGKHKDARLKKQSTRLGLQSHTSASGGSHSGASELNLGQLRQQTDNQRLSPVGYGFELKTHFSGAIRSGSGLLLTADKRAGNDSGTSSPQLDSQEAQAQVESAKELLHNLTDTAQQHKAMLPVLQTSEAKPDKLPAISQLEHNLKAIQAKDSGTGKTGEGSSGGAGQTVAYSDPLLVLSAPAGIAMLTPQSASFNAGQTTAIAAGQDINLLAQANAGHSVKSGISLFTYGKASNPKKPNQEVGISLHAASGKVSSQSQSDKTQITADKAITVASTTDAVSIQAPKHVLLTAQGAYIKMSGGNIEVHAPGKVDFKASMKSWTGPKSDSNSIKLPASSKIPPCALLESDAVGAGKAVI